jgi:RND family efflux transporter MFP subunit
MARAIWYSALAPLIVVALCAADAQPIVTSRPVRVATDTLAPAATPLILSGSVQARIQADLGFRVAGKIVRRPVDIGQRVKAGQILAELDPIDLSYSEQSAEAGLRSAEANAAQAAADLQRYDQLGRNSPAYLPSEYDRRLAAARVAQANVTQAQRQLALARDQRSYGTLTADADGIVTAVPGQVGQVMAAGQTVVALGHSDEIEIVADVPENRLADLRAAADITIKLWALPDLTLRAKLREIGGLADPASRTFAAKLSLQDAPLDRLALGMTATVTVHNPGADVAILPASAITDQDGQPAVWVLDPRMHRAAKHRVLIAGYDQDGHVAIAQGLNTGDKVITAGAPAITADMALTEWVGATR